MVFCPVFDPIFAVKKSDEHTYKDTFQVDTVIVFTCTETFHTDTVIVFTYTGTFHTDTVIVITCTETFHTDTVIVFTCTETFHTDTVIVFTCTGTFHTDTEVEFPGFGTGQPPKMRRRWTRSAAPVWWVCSRCEQTDLIFGPRGSMALPMSAPRS
jgi:hypothetical protein